MKNKYAIIIALTMLSTQYADLGAAGVNFRLKDLEGKKVELAQNLKQGPALVSFWATWCHPCQDELKFLQRLYQQYSDSGLTFYAVSIDGARDRGRVRATVKGRGITLPVLLDPEQEVQKAFGLSEVPGLFIISTNGEIIYRHLGYKPGDEAEIRARVREVIRGMRVAEIQSDSSQIINQKAQEDSL